MPMTHFISVLLPLPLVPSSATVSAVATRRATRLRAPAPRRSRRRCRSMREATRQDRPSRLRGCGRPPAACRRRSCCRRPARRGGREAHHRAHDVLDQDDRDALLVEPEQHREDFLDLGGRQPGHRLVGDQQLAARAATARASSSLRISTCVRSRGSRRALSASPTSASSSWQRASIRGADDELAGRALTV